MALKTFILENSSTKKQRQSDIQKSVREFLNNPKAKVVYDEKGRPSVENVEKKVNISITCCGKVMLLVIFEKAIGIDGEHLPSVIDPEKKIDYIQLAERFFSYDEVEYLRDSKRILRRQVRPLRSFLISRSLTVRALLRRSIIFLSNASRSSSPNVKIISSQSQAI